MWIIILIAMIAGLGKVSVKLSRDRPIILEKGVSENQYQIFRVIIWLPILAHIIPLFIPMGPTVLLILLQTAIHVPTLWVGHLLQSRLGGGYDYQRKAGDNIEVSLWITYGSIGVITIGYVLNTLIQGASESHVP